MKHDLEMHLKCIKVKFSNKQIVEIKKKQQIGPNITYSDMGEYNVENLKLSRRCHESCKTHPKGKKNIYSFFNNKRAF